MDARLGWIRDWDGCAARISDVVELAARLRWASCAFCLRGGAPGVGVKGLLAHMPLPLPTPPPPPPPPPPAGVPLMPAQEYERPRVAGAGAPLGVASASSAVPGLGGLERFDPPKASACVGYEPRTGRPVMGMPSVAGKVIQKHGETARDVGRATAGPRRRGHAAGRDRGPKRAMAYMVHSGRAGRSARLAVALGPSAPPHPHRPHSTPTPSLRSREGPGQRRRRAPVPGARRPSAL